MTTNDLRTHYKTIKTMIEKERRTREAVLSHSPKLADKLAECDQALHSLRTLGEWIAALLPVAEDATQPSLLDTPQQRRYV